MVAGFGTSRMAGIDPEGGARIGVDVLIDWSRKTCWTGGVTTGPLKVRSMSCFPSPIEMKYELTLY